MAVSVYARRYARTLFRIALESKELNRWQSELRKVDTLLEDRALCTLLEDPNKAWEDKAKVITQRLGEINPVALKLVALLTAKGKLALAGEIDGEFQRLVDEHRGVEGVAVAEIVTAVPLDTDYQLKLAQRITEIVGKPVRLKTEVDPKILGGIVIRVGDKLIDGSIRSKLEALRKELAKTSK